MKYSVIVPVYNVEKYIRECIDSILAQDMTDYELILIDDGSTDQSGMICDEYAKKHRLIQVIHQANEGQSAARNAGLSCAEGDYIIFIDSDDYVIRKDFLSLLAVKCDGANDIVFYGYRKFFDDKKAFGPEIANYPTFSCGMHRSTVIQRLLKSEMYEGSPWTKAVRREFLTENGINFVVGMISEDSEWFLQVMSRATSFAALNETIICYRQRAGSTSYSPKIKSLTDNIRMLETWSKIIGEMIVGKEEKRAFYSILSRYYGNMLIVRSRLSETEAVEHDERIRNLSYLLRYSITTRAKMIRLAYAFVGLKGTLGLLKMLDKKRK